MFLSQYIPKKDFTAEATILCFSVSGIAEMFTADFYSTIIIIMGLEFVSASEDVIGDKNITITYKTIHRTYDANTDRLYHKIYILYSILNNNK